MSNRQRPVNRIAVEPPDLTLTSNGRRVESMPRNRNVLWRPQHEKRVATWNPLRPDVCIFRRDIIVHYGINGGIGLAQIRTTDDPALIRQLRKDGWVRVFPTSEFAGVPTFDRGRFLRHRGYFKWAWQINNDLFHDSQTTGDSFLATWQYGRIGNADPTVKEAASPHDVLWAAARPSDPVRYEQSFKLPDGTLFCFPLARLPWNSWAKHLPWNWKRHWKNDAARVEENTRRYRRRLDGEARGYDDFLRWNGKCKCKFDETLGQAAWREQEQSRERDLDKNREHWRALPFRSMGLQPQSYFPAGEVWRKWFAIAWWLLWHQETIWPEQPKPEPHHWCAYLFEGVHAESAYCSIGNKVTVGSRFLSDSDVYRSERWRKWTAKIARPSKSSPVTLPNEILPLVLLAKQGNLAARTEIMDRFRGGATDLAGEYKDPTDSEFKDLINQAIIGTPSDNGGVTNGLRYAIDKYDQTKGAFPSFAMTSMRRAILKYLDKQPKHLSLVLDAKINPDDDDDDAPTWQDAIVVEGPDTEGGEYEAA